MLCLMLLACRVEPSYVSTVILGNSTALLVSQILLVSLTMIKVWLTAGFVATCCYSTPAIMRGMLAQRLSDAGKATRESAGRLWKHTA